DQREAVSKEAARRRARRDRRCAVRSRETIVYRASSEPCSIGILSVTVRRGGLPHNGRRRRVDDNLGRCRQKERARNNTGDSLPALDRLALRGIHLLYRVQDQFG